MTKTINILFFYFVICNSISIPSFAVTNTTALPEIHLLVDVSGSMKKTDPRNFRVTAIQILNYLIHQKAKMSITTFSTNTNTIIPLKLVNQSFQQYYNKNRLLITSDGAWTNIEKALEQANTHWGNGKRIIILLTDGKMDLGTTELTDSALKKLRQITIPALQKNRVQVYTLGFSNNVDKQLLNSISEQTNAISEYVISSVDLDHSLFSIYTAAIETEGASIHTKNNITRTFHVDKSVNEFTLIVEMDDKNNELDLIKPDGTTININNNPFSLLTINRHRLLKIPHPQTGEWVLSGQPQIIERALLLTDLKLVSNLTSGVYFRQESLSLSGLFENHGNLVISPIMTNNTEMTLEIKNDNGHIKYDIPYSGAGLFQKNITLNSPKGIYNAVWTVTNKLVSREHQFMMQVEDTPFTLSIDNNHLVTLSLSKPDLIDEKTVQVSFLNHEKMISGNIVKKNNIWEMNLTTYCQESHNTPIELSTDIKAKTTSGRQVQFNLTPKRISCETVTDHFINLSSSVTGKISQLMVTHNNIVPNLRISTKKPTAINLNKEKSTTVQPYFILFIKTILILVLITVFFLYISKQYFKMKINKIREKQ